MPGGQRRNRLGLNGRRLYNLHVCQHRARGGLQQEVIKRWQEKILSANAPLEGAVQLPDGTVPLGSTRSRPLDTEAMLLADIRYERACRERLFYRGLLRAL